MVMKNSNITKACSLFSDSKYTLVLCKGNTIYTDTENGIKPMMKLITQGTDLDGFCAADKIVGKAAAMLFTLAKISEVYGAVMSKAALAYLETHGIKARYDILADKIVNRKGNDICPMEKAVSDIDNAYEGYEILKKKVLELKMNQK